MSPKSSVPCPTMNTESAVLPMPIGKVWESLKNFQWNAMAPKMVTSVSKVSGEDGQIGACYKVTYAAGVTWDLRATAFSERDFTVGYEVLGTQPEHPASSIIGELRLQRVTDTNETYISWETVFSNDADQQVISDQHFKKLDFFADMKASCK